MLHLRLDFDVIRVKNFILTPTPYLLQLRNKI